MTQPIASALAEPFDQALLRRHDAKGITYVPISEVIARLNRVIGVGRWSYKVNRTWEAGEVTTETGVYPAWVMAHVTFSLEVPTGSSDAFMGADRSSHDGIGGQQVKFLTSGKGPVDLGDEYKGAVSDALKKATQHIGVGLDLARKDEALAWETAQRPPADWPTLEGYEAARESLRRRAQALPSAQGAALKTWWKAAGMAWPLTQAQAGDYAEQIAVQEAQVGAEKKDGPPSPRPVVDPPSTPAPVGGGSMIDDLAEVLGRLDRDQLKAVRTWAVAQGLPIAENGSPDIGAFPVDKLEALYAQVAAAA